MRARCWRRAATRGPSTSSTPTPAKNSRWNTLWATATCPTRSTRVNHFLRDFRTGDEHVIDRGLLDLLHNLARLTETRKPFQVISGYRSPKTNAMLRRASEGVAGRSLHMQGQAIDIRLADIPLGKLRAAALVTGRGGVGYYPASDFVHVDTGRVGTGRQPTRTSGGGGFGSLES